MAKHNSLLFKITSVFLADGCGTAVVVTTGFTEVHVLELVFGSSLLNNMVQAFSSYTNQNIITNSFNIRTHRCIALNNLTLSNNNNGNKNEENSYLFAQS